MFRIFSAVLLLLSLALSAHGAEGVLYRIDKQEQLGTTRMTLELSALAAHRIETSGQRIDLFLAGVKADGALPPLPENGPIIRILLARKGPDLMVSFLLRTPPKAVKVLTRPEPAALMLDLAWDEAGGRVRPAIAAAVPGMSQARPDQGSLTLGGASPYSGNWLRFFEVFEPGFRIAAPLRHSLPALPRLMFEPLNGGPEGKALKEGLELCQQGEWPAGLALFRAIDAARLEGVDREALRLFRGEALARVGELAGAEGELAVFLSESPESALRIRARYLLAWTKAAANRPYEGSFELAELSRGGSAYRPYNLLAALLQAEIHLAAGSGEKALAVLEGLTPPAGGELALVSIVRRADALGLQGRHTEALGLYRGGALSDGFWLAHPLSLARYAEALYGTGDFAAAAVWFGRLAEELKGAQGADLAGFAAGLSTLKAGHRERALEMFNRVRESHTESEGGFRAWLKMTDLAVLAGLEVGGPGVLSQYAEIARTAANRGVREEALFKLALVRKLDGDLAGCVAGMENFLRQFSGSTLYRHGQALLAEAVPPLVEELIGRGDEIDALVLVERHRDLLVSGLVRPGFLLTLGQAFERMGLLERAARVFMFMLDGFKGQPEEQGCYLPMVRVLVDQQDYAGAGEYAAAYFERFPKGSDRNEVFALRLQALLAAGRLDEAAKILTLPSRPASPEIELLAGKIYWARENFPQAGQVLEGARVDVEPQEPPTALMLRAESLYRAGQGSQALPLYERLAAGGPCAEQALFRCAQIRLDLGEREKALNIFRQLAEKGSSSPWQKAGAEFLQLEQKVGL